MTPRQWGTVLFTVMGIVLIATGVILGVTILAQIGGDMGGFFWRFLMFFAVPIGGGFALLALRETLAAMYLRDEPVQPSAMTPRDAVRVAIVVYGVWLMVETTLGFVLSLVTGGHGGGFLMDQIGGSSWFRALLGRIVQFAAGFVLATQSEAIADLVWRSPPRTGGDAPRP